MINLTEHRTNRLVRTRGGVSREANERVDATSQVEDVALEVHEHNTTGGEARHCAEEVLVQLSLDLGVFSVRLYMCRVRLYI